MFGWLRLRELLGSRAVDAFLHESEAEAVVERGRGAARHLHASVAARARENQTGVAWQPPVLADRTSGYNPFLEA